MVLWLSKVFGVSYEIMTDRNLLLLSQIVSKLLGHKGVVGEMHKKVRNVDRKRPLID